MPKPKKKAQPAQVNDASRPEVYQTPVSEVCVGEKAITVDRAKELLGYLEESDELKFSKGEWVSEIESLIGKKVKLQNNPNNRPIYVSNMLDLRQTMLTGKWRFNGEPIILSKTGLILNGQHTLIALLLAEHERLEGTNKDHWQEVWPNPITIEKLIVAGVSEDDAVVNTMDTCKSRSLADVIYREDSFKSMNLDSNKRRKISKVMEHAVRLLWDRTGAGMDAYSPRRTTMECVDFINRHSRLIDAVKHIWEENGSTDELTNYITLGYASGILYLMGTGRSDGEAYREMSSPAESVCDFELWEKALEFWTIFVSGDQRDIEKFSKPLKTAIGMLTDVETGRTGTLSEKVAILWKAWNLYLEGKPLTAEGLKLEYKQKADGGLKLLDKPNFGGIDNYGVEPEDEEPELTQEEIDANAAEEKANKLANKSEGNSPGMIEQYLADTLAKCPGGPTSFLIFQGKNESCNIWLEDAKLAAKILDSKATKRPDGTMVFKFNFVELDANLSLLRIKLDGRPIYYVESVDDSPVFHDRSKPTKKPLQPPTPASPTPAPAPKKPPVKPAKPTLRGGNG